MRAEPIIDAGPADAAVLDQEPEAPVRSHSLSVLGLVELLLKAPGRLDTLTRDRDRQADLIPRLLSLSLAGYSVFAPVLVWLLLAAPAGAAPEILGESWDRSARSAFALGVAYPVGLIAATGVCLPTFYFFGLLAGVQASVLQVTTHVLKGKAATAVLLLGVLPIYVAVTLGLLVVEGTPVSLTRDVLTVGLVLPFVAGLWGLRSIYVGFLALADTLPPELRCRRRCFLRRLTLAWAAVYTVVTPVMIYTLYTNLCAHHG